MDGLWFDNLVNNDLSIGGGLINIVITLLLSLLLKKHFEVFSFSLSGKKEIARLLPFLAMIICLIISIVKTSLALSLGLVGALSIVRFRTPVKEPEDLVYLFMAIAIGLGMGANQVLITVSATMVILGLVSFIRWKFRSDNSKCLYLNVTWSSKAGYDAEAISKALKTYVNYSDLKRFDVHEDVTNLSFTIDIKDGNKVFKLIESLKKSFPSAGINFIDQSRIPGV
jgi:hypothetical protein